jgi:pimeloyl-ACP methyl ester carboxylesterase
MKVPALSRARQKEVASPRNSFKTDFMSLSAGSTSGIVNGLYYQSYGAGDPVVALHGLGATMYSWRYLVEPLSKSHLLYLLDLKGHGKSEKPEDGKYSLHDQADLVVEFIKRLDLRTLTIIGHSMGGAVGLLSAIKLIEQMPNRLASLVLLDPVALPQKLPVLFKALRLPVLPEVALRSLPPRLWARIVLKLAYYDDSKITQDAVTEYAKNLETSCGRNALISAARQMVPEDIDVVIEKYHKIKVPTQIVWGRQDKIMSPASAILLNTQLENSVLMMVDRCGHIPHEEQASIVVPTLAEFVDKKSNRVVS